MSTETASQDTPIVQATLCKLCNGQATDRLFVVQERNVVKCRFCGFVFVDPWIEDSALYSEDYFTVRNRYVARQAEFRMAFERLLNDIDRRTSGGILLDVGCGPGLLLDVARQHGWEPHGIEVSEWAAKYACSELHLPVLQGTLEEANYPSKHFDAIVINHVLEHVPEPAQLLDTAHRILKDNGLLVVGVPNIGSVLARLNKERWPSLLVQQHRWHFSVQTLTTFLTKSGFYAEGMITENRKPWGGIMKRSALTCLSVATRSLNSGEAMVVFARKVR